MKNIIYIGDIHGNFNHIMWYIRAHKITNTTLIQVGDFGIGFKPTSEHHMMKILNEELGKRGTMLLVIRGNHDNPMYFDGKHDYEFIKFLPDYTEMGIDGLNHLFIGGAISIDRTIRTNGIDYWDNEGFISDMDKASSIRNIDVLVTHTAPDFVAPIGFNAMVYGYAKKDSDLLNDLEIERTKITEVFNEIKKNNQIKHHFYGHFHDNVREHIDGCNHVMLGEGHMYNPYLYE